MITMGIFLQNLDTNKEQYFLTRQNLMPQLAMIRLPWILRGWGRAKPGLMDKALAVTGQLTLLQIGIALPPAITEDLTMQTNASKTVGNHLSNCKSVICC